MRDICIASLVLHIRWWSRSSRRGRSPSIRSFTRSPISLIHALTFSRSRGSGQEALPSVVCSSFFMYARARSESKVGRGDGADGRGEGEVDRGVGGVRSPEAIVVAIGRCAENES